jgi:hypothetical protein
MKNALDFPSRPPILVYNIILAYDGMTPMNACVLRLKTTVAALLIILTALCPQVFSQTAPATTTTDNAPFKIEIEQNRSAEAGKDAVIVIRLRTGHDRLTGFSFLLAFDTVNMAFKTAEPGGFVKGHGWEQFSVEPITPAPGDTIAPVCLLRVTAALGKGVQPDTLQKASNGLVRLVFYLDTKRATDCKNYPVRFFWRTCEDNLVLDGPEKTPYYVREVHDLQSNWSLNTDPADDCLAQAPKGPETPRSCRGGDIPPERRGVVYFNGGIIGYCSEYSSVLGDIDLIIGYCSEYSSVLGDMDLDGLPNQATDVAALASFLVHGCLCGYQTDSLQFLLKSVNRSRSDSLALTISSLAYANRVVSGDYSPAPVARKDSLLLDAKVTADAVTLSYDATTQLGALMLTLETDSGAAEPIVSEKALGRQAAYGRFDGRLCLIVYDIGKTAMPQGKQSLGSMAIPGLKRVLSAKAVDYQGNPVKAITTGN